VLEQLHEDPQPGCGSATQVRLRADEAQAAIAALKRWGLKTLGELATLPSADLSARLGRGGRVWQAVARGEDTRPLVPMQPEERFEGRLELEWPIDAAEPLSFVLTRLLEPLSTRLERRDRGAAVLHVELGLVTRDVHACRLELPTPLRDVRALRTLALLDFESRPPAAAIDTVTVIIEPTPGRILQHCALCASASHARAAVHLACASRRAHGPGPYRRAGTRGLISSWSVYDGALRN
jgi:hypothetical protein